MIENVDKRYKSMADISLDDIPFIETIKKQEIEKINQKFAKKKDKKKIFKFKDRIEEVYSNKAYTFVQGLENEGANSAKAIACRK